MEYICNRMKKIMNNNKGLTLVEVMVAFAILMTGIAGLAQTTNFSLNLTKKAAAIQKGVDELESQYNDGREATATVSHTAITLTFDDGRTCTMDSNLKEYTQEVDGKTYKMQAVERATD